MGLPVENQDATEARIASLAMPSGSAWSDAARAEALARFRAMGLPGPRDEYWRFTRHDAFYRMLVRVLNARISSWNGF